MSEAAYPIDLYNYRDDGSTYGETPRGLPLPPNGNPAGLARPASPDSTAPLSARSNLAATTRARAPNTMLDVRPSSARVPGYTGHQPGIVAESLLGRSYAYITGYRKDMLHADDDSWLSEYHRNHVVPGDDHMAAPLGSKTPLHVAARQPRPTTAAYGGDGTRYTWSDKDKYYSVLNLNKTGRTPGYTGHVPHFRFQGSVGLPYAKACNEGDHLLPPDGSQCRYRHVEPHRDPKGFVRGAPIAGYSGFMPYLQDTNIGKNYHESLATVDQLQMEGPARIRKEFDVAHCGYTPSMVEAIKHAKPHQAERTPYGNEPSAVLTHGLRKEELKPRGVIAGYCGFRPGTAVSRYPPDRYRPRIELSKPRKEKHLRGSIYMGDLTQEWNQGDPYWRTNHDYGCFTPQARPKGPNHDPLEIVQQFN
eukprot:CAMPEP_0173394858 /NCGR_PEP_ID=MMETSP1356-20130122/29659_1 /TAXON_ID=77927 ORGANISM="Hemiselmis virescens, Strain PCC157" /NCGR_SAMPLE_ID=MMETSP1356 /ASSEMBLY_ACC=CAM_ASM_000847 /LENGTH=418 /DNA_ID=CAMNT_0014353391 /DNA_START=193 /DNA_END=1449 /DNA_ORIENTATION=+